MTTKINFEMATDNQLLRVSRKYGRQVFYWRRKFIGLLPEINRRRLYEKRGYSGIVEFGKREAGLSEAQIRLALNLEKRFSDKPELYASLVEGRTSINKLTRVASIATPENEASLAASAQVLSNRSLEVLVHDIKSAQITQKSGRLKVQNGLHKPQKGPESLHVQRAPRLKLRVDVVTRLKKLQEKGIDVNELINVMLDSREQQLADTKSQVAEKIHLRERERRSQGKAPSRYISTHTKQVLEQEYGTKCAHDSCTRDAADLHHTVPFALSGSNNPYYLAPLCKEHHDIAHAMNSKFVSKKQM